jgi:hypothetical protein
LGVLVAVHDDAFAYGMLTIVWHCVAVPTVNGELPDCASGVHELALAKEDQAVYWQSVPGPLQVVPPEVLVPKLTVQLEAFAKAPQTY